MYSRGDVFDVIIDILGPIPTKRIKRREWNSQYKKFADALDTYMDVVKSAARL